ncbi:hypothetical protein Q73A0000_00430 [Kaistella flava (ex Peng et al. 2021)]|uniref:Cytochrome c domain-containing protein n=1 Tax=Kaistella flava (ex Peng et al. 2021) TaxID=2038776 RepID=A0A7M2Y3W7_9FLAO|nr:hypothetical protein [Kaistella flava (ex Peng et al. 2021)]QOW08918.1 hypothetical protein Q73A0000_00430 [Kaistella flava (ex Peng et al. 2021)]
MLRNRKSQKFLASLFTAVYLFVALFSQSFHDHGSGEVFKDFHFTKAEKTFTKTTDAAHYSDCLSCHILHEGKYVSVQDFFFSAISIEDFHLEIFSAERTFRPLALFNFQLRGPPSFFI